MKTVETKVYEFNELRAEAKEKALDDLRFINLECEWFDFVYCDASEVGIDIESFDLDRNLGCVASVYDCYDTAQKIISNHGFQSDTYQEAKVYMDSFNDLEKRCKIDSDYDGSYEHEHDEKDLDSEFIRAIEECYTRILQNEYEYLYSDEAIIETIEANEWYFTIDGKLYS